MEQPFKPADRLTNRTFVGLILAQFLAAFNDQCIHAAAMFYAIREAILEDHQAITLMPILFYAPWAIFCTLAGYLADRYSKRSSLVFWKIAEVVITAIALVGFAMSGKPGENDSIGPWIVLSTVFLMGLHSAFFVPAKYGVMPEILHPSLLSRGNGVLESTSFMAVILGTVSGGVLSFIFDGGKGTLAGYEVIRHEYYIGILLVGLAIIGAIFSFMIRKMPAANPERPFPWNPIKPLAQNLRVLLRSRPLALAVLGIAFFTFMVAYMRAAVYMHGEAHHWNEFKISLIVATVGLGIGLGSPLAGYFSGAKIELGLVPLGAVGMVLGTLMAGLVIGWPIAWLVGSIISIGFFAGFYIVPLYTLLQHRAPKTSKGDLIATSNFVNVTGAIAASLLLLVLVFAAEKVGIITKVPQEEELRGVLLADVNPVHGLLHDVKVDRRSGTVTYMVQPLGGSKLVPVELHVVALPNQLLPPAPYIPDDMGGDELSFFGLVPPLSHEGQVFEVARQLGTGEQVVLGHYNLRDVPHFRLQRAPESNALERINDKERLPPYLFIGASVMTLGILFLLCRQLPDFFVRTFLWIRSHGRYQIKVHGVQHLPTDAAAILATNCHTFQECMHVLSCTDRKVRFILVESNSDGGHTPLLRYMARNTGMVILREGEITPTQLEKTVGLGLESLQQGGLVAVTAAEGGSDPTAEKIYSAMEVMRPMPIVPVFCGTLPDRSGKPSKAPSRVRVVIGEPLPPGATVREVRAAIAHLGRWLEETSGKSDVPHH